MEAQNYQFKIKEKIPSELVVSSIGAIVFIIALLPFIAWLLEYKDTISGPMTITTKTTPVDIFSKAAGELVLLIDNNGIVKKGEQLAVIKNAADFTAINQLKSVLNQPDETEIAIAKQLCEMESLNVGELQSYLIDLTKAFDAYYHFLKTDRHEDLVQSRKEQVQLYENRLALLHQKSGFLDADKALSSKFAEIDKQLLEKEVIAERDYDQSSQQILGKEMAELDNKTQLNTLEIQIKTLQQEVIEINSQFDARKILLKNKIKNAFHLLKNQLKDWDLKYLIGANVDGLCVYKDYLNDYRYVEVEEKIFSIIPQGADQYFGLAKLPIHGIGKVRIGQSVNVKLDNYPFMEFGILKGEVADIAALPSDNQYNVQIHFPQGFISTYGENFTISQLMHGTAEVIVAQKSLYDRIVDQVKSVRLNR